MLQRPRAASLILTATTAALITLAPAPTAKAQNALGGGRALDANLQVGTRFNPRGRDIASELRFRNAVVTGNIPGGFSFRGDLGYRAADDFRGDLGSNDLFEFQRDSLYSAAVIGSVSLRSTDALRYQMRFATGGQVDERYGLPIVRRPGAGASGNFISAQNHELATGERKLAYDSYTLTPGTLRSVGSFASSRVLSPRILGQYTAGQEGDDQEQGYIVGTPLRGISQQANKDYVRPLSANFLLASRAETLTDSLRQDPNTTTNRIENERATYRQILDQLEETARPEADPTTPINPENTEPEPSRIDQILGNSITKPNDDTTDGAEPTEPNEDEHAFENRLTNLMSRLQLPTVNTGTTKDDLVKPLTADDRNELIRDASDLLSGTTPHISRLSPPASASRDLYAEIMQLGERFLSQRNWFEAEEQFTAAIRIKPGDPLAAAGRVNAQIGASMYRSAAIDLQMLLRTYPEMIGVRYAQNLLPSKERLDYISLELTERMQINNDFARSCAILAAYIGHQTQSREAIEEAFQAVDRITQELNDQPDPLYDVLRAIWLDDANDTK